MQDRLEMPELPFPVYVNNFPNPGIRSFSILSVPVGIFPQLNENKDVMAGCGAPFTDFNEIHPISVWCPMC
jgi:hypothetical protein